VFSCCCDIGIWTWFMMEPFLLDMRLFELLSAEFPEPIRLIVFIEGRFCGDTLWEDIPLGNCYILIY
jgi:hypothetical protein